MCLKNEEKGEAESESEETTKHSSNFYGSEATRRQKQRCECEYKNKTGQTYAFWECILQRSSWVHGKGARQRYRMMTWWISEKYRVVCRPYVCRSGGSFSSMWTFFRLLFAETRGVVGPSSDNCECRNNCLPCNYAVQTRLLQVLHFLVAN